MLTLQQLKKIMPNAKNASEALPILNAVAKQYEINNERRMAAWLATLAVESGELKYQEEIASGAAYEGRADLGNTQKGDGRKFKGHGRIQITGRDNHTRYTNYLKRAKHLPFIDFTVNAKALAQEPYATDAAGWFWTVYKKLNTYADKGDFLTTQVRVNGRNRKTGLPNHYDVRQKYYTRALSVLPDNFTLDSGAVTPSASSTAVQSTPIESTPQNVEPPPTQIAEQIINTGDTTPPEPPAVGGGATDPTVQVSQGGFKSVVATVVGSIGGGATAIWGAFTSDTGIMVVGIVCVTLLLLSLIFRQVLMDWLRMKLHADPKQGNVK